MPPKTPTPAPDASSSPHSVDPPLHWIRGHRVILDADLARMYGVSTKQFNQALKRNQDRFPEDFAFQSTEEEFLNLRSQIVTSSSGPGLDMDGDPNLKSQFVISSLTPPKNPQKSKHGGRRSLPWAFTEHGAVMAANLLKSEQAVRMSVYVVRAFVKMREQIAANQAILQRLAEIDGALLEHDSALRDIYDKLLLMLEPPDEEPDRPHARRMGFHRDG